MGVRTESGNLFSLLRGRFGPADKACLRTPAGGILTYERLDDLVGRMAAELRIRGVAPGDRIVVQTPKSPEALALYLATLKVGAVFTPLNTAYTAAEIDYFLRDAEPALVVRDAVAFAAVAMDRAPDGEVADRSAGDLASLIYTSGTTGRSKGAMLSHGALAANALALTRLWDVSDRDVLLHALPIFHVHGLFVATHCALLGGAAMVWLDRYDDDQVMAALADSTVMMGVPTFYTRLLANPALNAEAVQQMRLFVSGSAPLLPSAFAAFEARTGHRILERYGMSEAAIITSNPLGGERLAGSVGYALPGVEVRIGGGGETGPIEIRGPSLFSGYWRMPEKTAEAFTADGFFVTGDLGRLDADGRLWVSGRQKDLIISGGYNVYPKELELLLDETPGVVESAVIGVPHPDLGEAVVAVLAGEGDEARTLAALRGSVAGFKRPKRVLFVDDLPRNAMGKVQKALLRQQYADLFAVQTEGVA